MNLQGRISEDLWAAVRSSYTNGNYSAAVLDGVHHLSSLIRERSGADGDGATLIGQAFGGKEPKLKVNPLRTETERNIQKGVEQLLRGFYQAIRNPRSHGPVNDTEHDADTILLFVNFLCGIIGEARAPFSRADFLERVLEPQFVPTEEYAVLLLAEIPDRYRLDVFLDLWTAKSRCRQHHRLLLSELLSSLSKSDLERAYQTVSDTLTTCSDDELIHSLRILPSHVWPHVRQIAKLRVENRIIQAIGKGSHDGSHLVDGVLGAWASGLATHFSMKKELLSALLKKLHADRDQQEYVLRYLRNDLVEIIARPSFTLESAIRKGLKKGDSRYYSLLNAFEWDVAKWSTATQEALADYRAKDAERYSDFDYEDDDLPF
jgi:uncharacterized protein (TIGR02391 family)